MNRALHQAIFTMVTQPDGWVRVESVHRVDDGIVLVLGLYAGKKGERVRSWEIRCRRVQEAHICDLDGGGIGLYEPDHPVCRQYTAGTATLRCAVGDRRDAAVGSMLAAHVGAVDDWIPFDRYVSGLKAPMTVRGPAFLIKAYAAALRDLGLAPTVSAGKSVKGRARYRALHFGNSFVVAAIFEARAVPRS
jgi:hypothetical protein